MFVDLLANVDESVDTREELAGVVAEQWTGKFNPTPVDAASLEELYRCAM